LDNKSSIILKGGKINQNEFYSYFAPLKQIKKIFVLEQDYAGGFSTKLAKLKKTLILSSTKKTKRVVEIPGVEELFWKRIGKGENAKRAYKNYINDIGKGHRVVMNILHIVSLGSAKNYYIVLGRGNIDIPRK
jgi:hypothetical protein